MRIYPSTEQKQIIKLNCDISRTVYNKMVAIDRELYRLKQVSHLANHYRCKIDNSIIHLTYV